MGLASIFLPPQAHGQLTAGKERAAPKKWTHVVTGGAAKQGVGGAGLSQAVFSAGCPENVGLPSGEIGRKSDMVFGIGAVTFTHMYQHLISPARFVCFSLKFTPDRG